MLQRIHHLDPNAISTWEALEMATRDGASVLGIEEEVGSVEVGKRADIMLVNLNQVHLQPVVHGRHSNVVPLIVWCARPSDVTSVFVDGKLVVENGTVRTVSEEQVIVDAQEVANRVLT